LRRIEREARTPFTSVTQRGTLSGRTGTRAPSM
jgi:hypothetical protein